MNANVRGVPVTDNSEVIFDSLVVDICGRLEKGHRHFSVADSFGNSGHSLGKTPPCLGRARGKVEHR